MNDQRAIEPSELALLAAALRGELVRQAARGRRPRSPQQVEPAPAPARVAAAPANPPAARAPAAVALPSAAPSPWRVTSSPPRSAPPRPVATPAAPLAPVAAVALARAAPDLAALAAAVAGCRACGLCETRTQTVFSDGAPRARVMFVGEAPGADEDAQGVPFVGAAGKLLSDIIAKGMGLDRQSDVHVANVLKCRPPGNRDPEPEEKRQCAPWLERQIELVDPEVIVPLGRHAAQHVLRSEASIGQLRGRVHRVGGRAIVPTYHPAYLLRTPSAKRETWQDIQLAMNELGLPRPTSAADAARDGESARES